MGQHSGVCRARFWGERSHFHHSHPPPPSPVSHIKWPLGWDPLRAQRFRLGTTSGGGTLQPALRGCIPGAGGRCCDSWALPPARISSPPYGPPAAGHHYPPPPPGSPVPGYPAEPFSCTAARRLVVSTAKRALITCSRRQNERELALNYMKFICFGGESVCSI